MKFSALFSSFRRCFWSGGPFPQSRSRAFLTSLFNFAFNFKGAAAHSVQHHHLSAGTAAAGMRTDARSPAAGLVDSTLWRRGIICRFFHCNTGCLRKKCAFVHSIHERVNELLDDSTHGCVDTSRIVERLLMKTQLFPKDTAETHEDVELARAVLDEVSQELASAVASEAAAEAIAEAVHHHMTAFAATVSVVDAIAVTEDPGCPYLRASLFCELERSFARTTDTPHADGEQRAKTNKQHILALAAFMRA